MNENSGRKRNVPRPSHGDISCIGSGTRGVEKILLDDHHIDDDDEGVELTKPGVKPSNAIRSNILNPLPDPVDRTKLLHQPPIVKRSGAANGSAGEIRQQWKKGSWEWVEVLEKSKKDLEQARNKDEVLFEEASGKERKLNEENHETFKEEMIKDTNEKLSSRC
uniref:Uncharacterized protein n=1 Tax=Tanacetum cinerariifolium TaxID=118510 RepID=A0A6L2M4Z1_TANCI|nr:hypothetical protein [Tanacetum cinerariifolium]